MLAPVTDGFDAELFLRLVGERLVLERAGRRPEPWPAAPLYETASALVAVGALDEPVAEEVLTDYERAMQVRGAHGLVGLHRPPPSGRPSGDLPAARVWACDEALELAGGRLHLHCVALRPDGASLLVSFAPAPAPGGGGPPPPFGRPRPMAGRHPMAALQQVTVVDDRGTAVTATFSGGGSPATWRGQLQTGPGQALSTSTRWLEIGGTRVVLGEPVTPPAVTVEPLGDAGQAERFLWGRLTSGRHGPHGGPHPPMVEAAVEALVAAGALAADSPVIEQVADVMAAFSGQVPARRLPDPWQSLVRSLPRQGSRSFLVPLGVVTPPLSGPKVAVDAVFAQDGVLEAQVRVTGPGPWGQRFGRVGQAVSWWAEDDLGNHYLGSPGNGGGGPEGWQGTIGFWPSLDDRASALTLAPTGADARALIRFDLPAKEPGR